MPLADDVDLDVLADRTTRYSGADLENLVRKAGLLALRADADVETVTMVDFETALKETRPSVTEEMERDYERMVSQLKQESPTGARRIGFALPDSAAA